jgi:hypothetical protein
MPPTIPAINPEKGLAPEANAIPKQSGKATKNTNKAGNKFCFISFMNCFSML